MGLSLGHVLLLLVVVLIIFGAGKLPKVMEELAKGIKAFKGGLEEETVPAKNTTKALQSRSTKAPSKKKKD